MTATFVLFIVGLPAERWPLIGLNIVDKRAFNVSALRRSVAVDISLWDGY